MWRSSAATRTSPPPMRRSLPRTSRNTGLACASRDGSAAAPWVPRRGGRTPKTPWPTTASAPPRSTPSAGASRMPASSRRPRACPWNEVVCTPERCREVLDRVTSTALGVIFDPVSLLHPTIACDSAAATRRMLTLCGDAIRVLHAKDFEVVNNEDAAGWCDGSGSRLLCHGAGETGAFDFALLAKWARDVRPGVDCVIENSTPATNAACRDYLLSL